MPVFSLPFASCICVSPVCAVIRSFSSEQDLARKQSWDPEWAPLGLINPGFTSLNMAGGQLSCLPSPAYLGPVWVCFVRQVGTQGSHVTVLSLSLCRRRALQLHLCPAQGYAWLWPERLPVLAGTDAGGRGGPTLRGQEACEVCQRGHWWVEESL